MHSNLKEKCPPALVLIAAGVKKPLSEEASD